jgi:hypothetical protein
MLTNMINIKGGEAALQAGEPHPNWKRYWSHDGSEIQRESLVSLSEIAAKAPSITR